MRNFHINTQNKNMIWLELGLLAALCAAQFAGLGALCALLTGAVLLYILLTERLEDTVLALFLAMPMFNLFNHRIGTTSMFYLFVFVFWYKYFKRKNWNVSGLKLLVLMAFLGLRLCSGDWESTAKGFVLFSVLVLCYREDCMDGQLGKIVKYMTISFLISSAFGYLMHVTGRSLYMRGLVYVDGVTTIRFAGLLGDSVFYSQFCCLLLGANLALGVVNKRYLPTALVFAVALSGFCLLTYAKTGVVLMAVVWIAFVGWQVWDKAKMRTTILFSALIVLAFFAASGGFLAYLLSDDANIIIKNYFTRFTTEDLFTGRLTIWAHYWELLTSDWRHILLPMPQYLYDAPFYVTATKLLDRAHNIYLETACVFGVIPTELILLWLGGQIVKSITRRDGIMNLMPMGVILASGLGLHGHFDHHYYFIAAMALAFCTYRQHAPEGAFREL